MIELPAHGDSPGLPEQAPYYSASADQLDALRQKLGIESWHVLAYSIGAWVAKSYSEKYPQHIQRMVLLCPAVLSLPGSFSLRGLRWVDQLAPTLGSALLSGWRLHALVRILGFGGANHPYAALWTREISAQPVQLIKRLLHQLPSAGRAPFRLPDQPTLYLWAKKDVISVRPKPFLPRDHLIPGYHSAPMLSADVIAREVLTFLQAA